MFDGAAFGKEMVGIVRGYVDKAFAPLRDRLDALEARSTGISQEAAQQLVADAVAKAVASLPEPQSKEPWRPTDDEIRALLQPMVDAIPKPEPGKSVTLEEVARMVEEQVAKAVTALPAPESAQPS